MGGMLSLLVPPPILLLFKAKQKYKRKARRKEQVAKETQTRRRTSDTGCFSFCKRIFRSTKVAILAPFCPCLVKLEPVKRTSRNRRFDEPIQESLSLRLFKSFLGFTAGIGFSLLIFLFLIHVTQMSLTPATVWSCGASIVLSLGLAFSLNFRCTFFLMLPSFFTKRGRAVLLAYAFVLTFSGPAVNISNNLNKLTKSLSCQQEALKNRTLESLSKSFSPLLDHIGTIKRILRAAKQFAELVREAFYAFLELFKEVLEAIKRTWRWLRSILDVCPRLMELPEQECRKHLAEKQEECMKIMTILFFLCYMVQAFADGVCPLLKAAQMACVWMESFKENTLEPLKQRMESFFGKIRDGFYFNITTDSYYNYTQNQSQTFSDITASILQEIQARTYGFLSVVYIGVILFSLTFTLVLLKALLYKWRYLRNDRFDNVYITEEVCQIDERRRRRGQETILPLGYFESRKYVSPFSLWLLPKERKALSLALCTLINSSVQISVYLFLDYILFWLLERLAFYGQVQITAPVPFRVQLEVGGNGLLADMFRDMVDAFAPLLNSVPALDMSGCLPEPDPPDLGRRRAIILLLMLCFLLSFARAYGLRFRSAVCACYYPHRDRHRAAYLYNHILRTRGGFLKMFRRKIRLRKRNDDNRPEHKTNILDLLAAKYKAFNWMLKLAGYRRQFCLGCGQPKPGGDDGFTQCASTVCGALYCSECFQDLEGNCTACLQPFQYDDLSDMSEYISSDEEKQNASTSKGFGELRDEDFAYQYQRPKLNYGRTNV